MFRTTLLLATLCVLAACDKTKTPLDPGRPPQITTLPPDGGPDNNQGVRGILRRTMIDSVEVQWDLELGDGTFYKLIGGPVDSYEALLGHQVFVTGVAQDDGSFSVNTLEEDTQIYEAFRHRMAVKK